MSIVSCADHRGGQSLFHTVKMIMAKSNKKEKDEEKKKVNGGRILEPLSVVLSNLLFPGLTPHILI